MNTWFFAAVILTSCASDQPRVCALSQPQLTAEHRDARLAVDCSAYAKLDDCPAAQEVDRRYAKLWDQWEACQP